MSAITDLQALVDVLTPRQVRVLRMLCDGMTATQIASRMYRSHRTVEGHVREIHRRTGEKGARLVRLCVRVGFIQA